MERKKKEEKTSRKKVTKKKTSSSSIKKKITKKKKQIRAFTLIELLAVIIILGILMIIAIPSVTSYINIPYPFLGFSTTTCVTAPIILSSCIMGLPLIP